MPINKKHQLSLFLAALSVSPQALASTCTVGNFDPANGSACVPASPGYYVPTAGASMQTPSPAGSFVANSGASEPTPAPPGYYVPVTAASAATQAPAGTYVPTSGATNYTTAPAGTYTPAGSSAPGPSAVGYYVPASGSSTPVAAATGYYAPATGLTNQIPAGGMAAPMTAAIQSSNLFTGMASDLRSSSQTNRIKTAIAYQRANVDQEGLASGGFETDLAAVAVQVDMLKSATSTTGMQFGFGHHELANNHDVYDDGNSFEFGLYHTGGLFAGHYQTSLVYGQTSYDNHRTIDVSRFSGGSTVANHESQSSSGDISWWGLHTELSYPLMNRLNAIGEFGVLSYSADDASETGTATTAGTPTAALTGLSADSVEYISVPMTLALGYDIVPKSGTQQSAPVTVEAGVIMDLAGEQDMHLNSLASPGYSFSLPITQSGAVEGMAKLKADIWQMENNFNLSSVIQGQFGADTSAYQLGFMFTKKW